MVSASRTRTLWFSSALLALVTAGMFVAGLNPQDYRFRNETEWIAGGPGLRFGRYGAAVTESRLTKEASERLARTGFTLELALERGRHASPGFGFIAVFHNGDDDSQLLVGQWRETIIVMNGDDYDYSRKKPRIAVDLSKYPERKIMLAVTTREGGTELYVDGKLVKTQARLHLRLPAGGRWILGNSAYGINGWRGGILGFAFFDRVLSGEEIERHHELWTAGERSAFAANAEPSQLYLFDEKDGRIVRDQSEKNRADLRIPRGTWIERELLGLRLQQLSWNRPDVKDYLLNLIGFMPFGLLSALTGIKLGLRTGVAVVSAVVLGLVFSFGIEYAQSWMPSRSSSALDLLLNTTGTLLGALTYLMIDSSARPDRFR